eukprot:Skav208707  [mRNA]  locus=scaffold42:561021:585932:- [translate_table: standard]
MAIDQFRRHVERCANLRLGQVHGGGQHLRHTEIPKFRRKLLPAASEENVLRLQIAMQDLLLMQSLQRPHNLREPFQKLSFLGHLRPAQVLKVGEHVAMLAILHEDAQMPRVIHEGIAIGDDVGMMHGLQPAPPAPSAAGLRRKRFAARCSS